MGWEVRTLPKANCPKCNLPLWAILFDGEQHIYCNTSSCDNFWARRMRQLEHEEYIRKSLK